MISLLNFYLKAKGCLHILNTTFMKCGVWGEKNLWDLRLWRIILYENAEACQFEKKCETHGEGSANTVRGMILHVFNNT